MGVPLHCYAYARGCIDKILRKNISPKIKCKVCILYMSMLSIYHLVSFSKKYPYHIYSVVSQKIVHGKLLTSKLVLFYGCHPLARIV
jgi:hypothetical protein